MDKEFDTLLSERQLTLSKKAMEMVRADNAVFIQHHALIPVEMVAHAGAAALIDTGCRILANMAAQIPPKEREKFIAAVARNFEPAFLAHVADAVSLKR